MSSTLQSSNTTANTGSAKPRSGSQEDAIASDLAQQAAHAPYQYGVAARRGSANQEELVARAHKNHKFELEQRRHEAAQRYHPHQNDHPGMVSNQHSDDANIDGVRNIN